MENKIGQKTTNPFMLCVYTAQRIGEIKKRRPSDSGSLKSAQRPVWRPEGQGY